VLIGLALLALVAVGLVFVLLRLRQEPEFYRRSRAELADPAVRTAAAETFQVRAEELHEAVEHDEPFRIEFTEQQINAWLLEELPRQRSYRRIAAVSDPLLELREGLVQLGARVESDGLHGIVSVEVRPRLAADGSLLLELGEVRAGEWSVPAERWLGGFRRQIEQRGWPVEIVSEDPLLVRVSVRRFGPAWRSLQIDAIEVSEGLLTLVGASDQT
jgi:hypothetical protein